MGHEVSRVHVCSLRARESAAEFEQWPLRRVRDALRRWRRDHDESALRTNALTQDEVASLLADDHGHDAWEQWLLSRAEEARATCDLEEVGFRESFGELQARDSSFSSVSSTSSASRRAGAADTLCKFQARIRGNQTRANVRAWRQHREKLFFEGPSGPQRVQNFFLLFCTTHDTANPFDGRQTIDALRFFAALAILCQGTSTDKADLLFEVFASLAPLGEIELTIALIIMSHAVAHVYADPTSELELTKGTNEEALERLAKRICQSSCLDAPASFQKWALANRPLADWIARTCTDSEMMEFALQGERWALVISDRAEDKPQDLPVCDGSSVGIFGAASSTEPLGRVAAGDPLRCLILNRAQACQAEELYVASLDSNGAVCAKSARVNSNDRHAAIVVHRMEFPRGMAQAFPFRADAKYWTPQDTIGVFDRACPLGPYGAFLEQKLHRALFQQQVVSFERFPRPESKLIWFDDFAREQPRYLSFAFEDMVPYAPLDKTREGISYIVGDRIVSRINVRRQLPCSCKGACGTDCSWLAGDIVEIAPANLKVRFVREEDPELSVEEFDFCAFISFARAFSVAAAETVPCNGDRILCRSPSSPWEYLPSVVIDSGWLELRYIQADENAAAATRQGRLCIARSPPFRLNLAPFELGDLVGTDVDADIECELCFIRRDYINADHEGDYVGLFAKSDPPSRLLPSNRDLALAVKSTDLERGRLCFDTYHFKSSRGGIFEARFIHQGIVASVSKPLILRPIVILRDVYQDGHGFVLGQAPRMACLFEVVDPAAWTCWDRIELIAEGDPDHVLAWAYVSAQRREAQKAGVNVPEGLEPGTYRWKYTGFFAEACEVGKVFQVCELTEEDRLADLPPDEREEKIASDAARALELSRQQSSVRLQSWTRGQNARFRVRAELEGKRDEKTQLEAKLAEARAELADIEKSCKRRSANLISRRDRERLENAQSSVKYFAEQLSQLTAGVSAEQLEEEQLRVSKLRELAAQERAEREECEAEEREAARRAGLRAAREVRRWPFAFPDRSGGLCLDTTDSAAAAELAQWVEGEGAHFHDDDFPATLASVKSSSEAWMTYVLGSPGRGGEDEPYGAAECGLVGRLVWLRPASLFAGLGPKNAEVPLVPEELCWRKIPEPTRMMASEALVKLEPFHMALMALSERSPHIPSQIVDATHAHLGLYTVKLFHKGAWAAVIIDDRLPAVALDRGTVPLLTSANPYSVGLWVYLVEKAVAKLFGSYETAFAQFDTVQSALAILSGGFAMNFDLASSSVPGPAQEAWEEVRPPVHESRAQGVTMPLHAAPNRYSDEESSLLEELDNFGKRFPAMDCFLFARTSGADCTHVQIVGVRWALEVDDEGGSRDDERCLEQKEARRGFVVVRKALGQKEEPLGRRWRWEGAWADDDDERWTEEMRRCFPCFDPVDDGSFWMTEEDFCATFCAWGVCAIAKAGTPCVSATEVVEWKATQRTAGGPRFPRSLENPILDIEADAGTIFVQLITGDELCEVRLVQMHLDAERPHIDVLSPESGGAAVLLQPNPLMAATYRLQLQLWAPGLESRCAVRVCGIGSAKRIALCAGDQHLELCKSHNEDIVASPAVLTLRGFPEPRPDNTSCPSCDGFVGRGGSAETVVLKGGGRWHLACASVCNFCGEHAPVVMALCRDSQVMEPTCSSCWEDRYADPCKTCEKKGPPALVSPEVLKDPSHDAMKPLEAFMEQLDIPKSVESLDGGCRACDFRDRLVAAEKCRFCGIALLPDEMELVPKEGARLHAICQEAFIMAKSPTCAFCEEPICEIEGRFSGKAKKCRLGVVHEECHTRALAAAGRRSTAIPG